MPGVFDDLIDCTNEVPFLTSCNSACRLVVITGGRGLVSSGLLKQHVADVGNGAGMSTLQSTLATICSDLHSATNSIVASSMPSVGGGLNDQEKALVYLVGIQSIINVIGSASTGIGGEDAETVCDALAACGDNVEAAAYALLDA